MGTKKSRSGQQFNPKGVTQGITLVCPNSGEAIDCVEDAAGIRRLAVDTTLTFPGSISVDLNGIDPNGDSVHIVDASTGYKLKINPDGSIDVNVRIDSVDGDNIAISSHPNPIFDEKAAIVTSSNFEEIYSYISTSSRTRIINVVCSINTTSLFRLKINDNIIRELYNSPSKRNVEFKFVEHRPLNSGDKLSIEVKVDRFFSNNSPYYAFSSLEGYLI